MLFKLRQTLCRMDYVIDSDDVAAALESDVMAVKVRAAVNIFAADGGRLRGTPHFGFVIRLGDMRRAFHAVFPHFAAATHFRQRFVVAIAVCGQSGGHADFFPIFGFKPVKRPIGGIQTAALKRAALCCHQAVMHDCGRLAQ